MKISDERTEMVCNAISQGTTLKTACQLAGIGMRTFERWIERAEQALEKDPEDRSEEEVMMIQFRRETMRAQVEQKETLEGTIYDAGRRDWRAAKAYLEAQFPATWSKKSVVEHRTPEKGPNWASEKVIEAEVIENE